MGAFGFELTMERGLCGAAAGYVSGVDLVFGGCDVVPGHRAWPWLFGLESAAGVEDGSGLVRGGDAVVEVARLTRPLVVFYGRECWLSAVGEVSAVVEVSLRSPWRLGDDVHGYLVDALRGFADPATREADVIEEVNGWLEAEALGYPWRMDGLAWCEGGEYAGRGGWVNSFDGWHWVCSGSLYVLGVRA